MTEAAEEASFLFLVFMAPRTPQRPHLQIRLGWGLEFRHRNSGGNTHIQSRRLP